MRASKGGLTHEQIMRLTVRQVWVYVDAFTWLLREESEEGVKKNNLADLRLIAGDERFKKRKERILADAKRKIKPKKDRVE
jgi:hypothetical protein